MMLKQRTQHVRFLINQGGVPRLFSHLQENVLFDLKHGMETSSWLETHKFANPPANIEHGVRYRASYTSEVWRALDIAARYVSDASLYDLGCGKGKVLTVAAHSQMFKRIVGIEYYKPFVEATRRNVQHLDQSVETLLQDASTFDDYDSEAVIYAYNPFDDVILEQAKRKIEARVKKAVFIYCKPVHEDLFSDWTLLDRKISSNEDRSVSIFGYGF